MSLLHNLFWRNTKLERLMTNYEQAITGLQEATREMDAVRLYVISEREELLNKIHKLELEVHALKIAVKRR